MQSRQQILQLLVAIKLEMIQHFICPHTAVNTKEKVRFRTNIYIGIFIEMPLSG